LDITSRKCGKIRKAKEDGDIEQARDVG
jgi:hypothetical protein